MSDELAGRVALITGAAHGQGRATALALAKRGMHVAALDVARPLAYPGYALGDTAGLDSLVAECTVLKVQSQAFAVDVRDDAAVKAAVSKTLERWGRSCNRE